eukprot:365087-Chlamydomonas_euryale.AAC.13
MVCSVIVAAAEHLFERGVQEDGVLKLRHIRALALAQRRQRVDDASVTQVLECHEVLGLPCTVMRACVHVWVRMGACSVRHCVQAASL